MTKPKSRIKNRPLEEVLRGDRFYCAVKGEIKSCYSPIRKHAYYVTFADGTRSNVSTLYRTYSEAKMGVNPVVEYGSSDKEVKLAEALEKSKADFVIMRDAKNYCEKNLQAKVYECDLLQECIDNTLKKFTVLYTKIKECDDLYDNPKPKKSVFTRLFDFIFGEREED